MRVSALVVAASFLFAVVGRVRAQQQSESGQTDASSRARRAGDETAQATAQPTPQAQKPKPAKPDETIDEDDVERVETDLTNILFTAVDRNKRFVTTLKQGDIRVLEDGVEQKLFTFQRETDRPLSLAILIDTSASQERTLPEEKSAAQQFVDTVIRPQKDEVAVLSFTGDMLALERAFKRIGEELRSQYLITYKPDPPFDGRYRRIEVKVAAGGGYKINAKHGYYADRDMIRK